MTTEYIAPNTNTAEYHNLKQESDIPPASPAFAGRFIWTLVSA